jgi:DNA-binding HxlR family transcriptional regulator
MPLLRASASCETPRSSRSSRIAWPKAACAGERVRKIRNARTLDVLQSTGYNPWRSVKQVPRRGGNRPGPAQEVLAPMRHESKQVPSEQHSAQRTVVLHVLEQEDGISSSQLSTELEDLSASTIADALAVLAREGVIVVSDKRVRGSRCTRHLDALSLICV